MGQEFEEATKRIGGIRTAKTAYDRIVGHCEWWYLNISAAVHGGEMDPVFMAEMFKAAPSEPADFHEFAKRRRELMLSALVRLADVRQYSDSVRPLKERIETEELFDHVYPWQAGKSREFLFSHRNGNRGYIFMPDAEINSLDIPGSSVILCPTLESARPAADCNEVGEYRRMNRWYLVGQVEE